MTGHFNSQVSALTLGCFDILAGGGGYAERLATDPDFLSLLTSSIAQPGHAYDVQTRAGLSPPNEPDRACNSQQDDGADRQRPEGLRFVPPATTAR